MKRTPKTVAETAFINGVTAEDLELTARLASSAARSELYSRAATILKGIEADAEQIVLPDSLKDPQEVLKRGRELLNKGNDQ